MGKTFPWEQVSSFTLAQYRVNHNPRTSSKASLDPLKDMKSHLAARSQALSRSMPPPPPPLRSNSTSSGPKDAVSERARRESSERARAEALITKRRAEMEASNASSVGGDTPFSVRDGGYSDVFNKKETREAHASWGRYSERRWDEDRDDRRDERSRERRREESRESRRGHRWSGDRDRNQGRDDENESRREWERERDSDRRRDMSRGERNRTRGIDDVRRRA